MIVEDDIPMRKLQEEEAQLSLPLAVLNVDMGKEPKDKGDRASCFK